MASRKSLGVIAAMALAAAAGCQESDYVPVSGEVLYQGEPLAAGVIMFQPANGPPARGTIVDGKFALENPAGEPGARIGPNKVRIASRAAPAGGEGEMALGRSLIPEHYGHFESSGLTADVKPEANEPFIFRLEDGTPL
ncbi:MAG: hypothetical protein CMJ58_12035 [Planctomycetaceae bacterium]|nr:hypothetical protein [Planctomycetaceae bacterium]